MNIVKKAKTIHIASSAALFLLGVALLVLPFISPVVMSAVIAGVCIFAGIAKIFGYFSNDLYKLAFQFDMALGVLAIILSAFVLIKIKSASISTIASFVGFYVIVDSLFKIQTAFDAKRFGMSKWVSILVAAVVVGLAGIVTVTDPFSMKFSKIVFMGISFIADGALNIWVTAYTVRIKAKKKNVIEKYEPYL